MLVGSTWNCYHKGQRCCFMLSHVAWNDLDSPPREGHATHGAVSWDPMSPKSGWRLGSLFHHICSDRCYLGLGLGKRQLFLKVPVRLCVLCSVWASDASHGVGKGEERLKHCLLPRRISHKVPGTGNSFLCKVAINRPIVQMRKQRLGGERLSWATQWSMAESPRLRHREEAWAAGSAG